MKTIKTLFALSSILALAGCGDDVGDTITNNYYYAAPSGTAPAPDANIGNDAGTDAKADSKTESDAKADSPAPDAEQDSAKNDSGNDAEAEAETDAQGDVQAEADAMPEGGDAQADAPNMPKILTIKYMGGINPMHGVGGESGVMYRVSFCTTKLIEVVEHGSLIDPIGNARTQGTANTLYFKDIVEKYNGQTVFGPTQLKVLPGDNMPRAVVYNEPHQIAAGTCETYTVHANLAAKEDATGEFIEQQYAMRVYSIGAKVLAGGDEPVTRWLDQNEYMWDTINGSTFTIKPCNPGTKMSCACAGTEGWTNCGTNYEPMACVCPQEGMQAYLTPDQPEPAIAIGGKDAWYPLTTYELKNVTAGQRNISRATGIQSNPNGTWKDYDSVALVRNGKIIAHGVFDQNTGRATFDGFTETVSLAPNGTDVISVHAKMAAITASYDGMDWLGAARSGHTPNFRLDGMWSDGNDFFTTFKDEEPKPLTLRQSMPLFFGMDVPNTVLSNTEMTLYREQVSVDVGGAIALKQRMYSVEMNGATLTVGQYRLLRNGFLVPDSTYMVTDALTGANLKTNFMGKTHYPAVAFATEMVESPGTSTEYVLRATIQGTMPGDSIVIEPFKYSPQAVTTNQVTNNYAYAPFTASPDIFLVGDSNGHALADILWSDISYLYHNYLPLGSKDWTHGFQVSQSKKIILSN